MVGIGMRFGGRRNTTLRIEETIVHASAAGLDSDDLRVLSVLTTWIEAHSKYINVDGLVRCVREHESKRVHAYWSAIAVWLGSDRRFAKLSKVYVGPRIDLLSVGSGFHLSRSGEDPRFKGTTLRVPAGILRDRPADISPPKTVAAKHAVYATRVRMGPSWRADAWAEIESTPNATAAEVARRAGCSTAWGVVQDYRLLTGSIPSGLSW